MSQQVYEVRPIKNRRRRTDAQAVSMKLPSEEKHGPQMNDRQCARLRIAERFHNVRKLGEGATGSVFEVIDRLNGGRFALKKLRHERVSLAQFSRFKDEFREQERISHRNLVKIHELIADEGSIYLVMELVQGVDFLRYVRPEADLPTGPSSTAEATASSEDIVQSPLPVGASPRSICGALRIDRLRDALAQLVRGVRALHRAGKVHRDIKPENVLVTEEGRVVILDFGLVTEARRDDYRRGTPAFMAPEQFQGICTESVDWYGVGMVLYCALSGRLADAGSPSALPLPRFFAPPIDPRVHTAGLPEDLVELALDLLQPDPARRPTGEHIERAIGIFPSDSRIHISEPVFVGRETQLAQLAAAFDSVGTQGSGVVHVHGESGIGKSSLLHEFARALGRRGATVLRGTCYKDASVPYKGLDVIMDRIAASVMGRGITLEGEHRDALATMFPVFRQIGDAPLNAGGGEKDPLLMRARAVDAFRFLLALIAEPNRVVICIDDFQWTDNESVDFLAAALRSRGPAGVLVVLGYRSTADGFGVHAAYARQSLACDYDLELGPLDEHALSFIVGASGTTDPAPLDAIVRESGGSPFFALELLRAWRCGYAGEGVSIKNVLTWRLENLPPEHLAYLKLVSIAGRPLEEAVLWRALGVSQEFALQARHALVAESLVRMAEDDRHGVEPYHDRIRAYLLGQLAPEDLRRCHAALAEGYEAEGPADPEILAVHFLAAEKWSKALIYAERAGDGATQALAFDHAAALYETAARLANGSLRDVLRRKQARALSNAGHPAEAARVFLEILDDRPGDVDLLLMAGDEFLRAGALERGYDLLRRAAEAIGEPIPRNGTVAALRIMWNWSNLWPLRFRAVPDEEVPAEHRQRLFLCFAVAMRLLQADLLRAVAFHQRYFTLALEIGSRVDVVQAIALQVCFGPPIPTSIAERLRHAVRLSLLSKAKDLLRSSDPPLAHGCVQVAQAVMEFAEGNWTECNAELTKAIGIFQMAPETRFHWEVTWCSVSTIDAMLINGDICGVRHIREVLRPIMETYPQIEVLVLLRADVVLALCEDRPDEARKLVADATQKWPRTKAKSPSYWAAAVQMEIDLYEHLAQAAWRQIDASWDRMKDSGLHRTSHNFVLHSVLSARVALAHGKSFAARRYIERLKSRRERWARALGCALQACLLLRGHSTRAAVDGFTEAVSLLDSCELRLFAAAARYRLASITGDSLAMQATIHDLSVRGVRVPDRLVSALLPC